VVALRGCVGGNLVAGGEREVVAGRIVRGRRGSVVHGSVGHGDVRVREAALGCRRMVGREMLRWGKVGVLRGLARMLRLPVRSRGLWGVLGRRVIGETALGARSRGGDGSAGRQTVLAGHVPRVGETRLAEARRGSHLPDPTHWLSSTRSPRPLLLLLLLLLLS
jgi:hypothetical protein